MTKDAVRVLPSVHRTPAQHPNDFLYLFRKVGKLQRPEFFWLDMQGGNRGTQKTYPSIYAALAPYIQSGWLDASW